MDESEKTKKIFWYNRFNTKYKNNLKLENSKWSDVEYILLETLVNVQKTYNSSLISEGKKYVGIRIKMNLKLTLEQQKN
ncbi:MULTISPECIES: hypothetical protein [unclassified Lactococcus]|uniref:hypothetical protein n=1 Tax=unclassified Lactococcus TaxID=2643510 RepID=UPI001650BD4A|nr:MULTISPECIES: hypothetical protein [unclassified Lactococcus]